ncbi:MAG: hypothetical protein OJF55_001538 [Rhodanobacteraceae bacterium]|jgi:hypothetical protein|nr:MAG: hypothetical protein OJF55_001538 [Rhodanobacteraceae bacterium]
MARLGVFGLLVALLALGLPQRAWALRCGNHLVRQGDSIAEVRAACGAPFFVDRYVELPGPGVETPVEPGTPVVVEAWYYNFGPQRFMVRVDFSGGVVLREQTLGYGFVGNGGPCDFNEVTPGMSVAELIGRCGLPPERARNKLAVAAGAGPRAPAWSETWSYPAVGSRPGLEIHLQGGKVTDIRIVH